MHSTTRLLSFSTLIALLFSLFPLVQIASIATPVAQAAAHVLDILPPYQRANITPPLAAQSTGLSAAAKIGNLRTTYGSRQTLNALMGFSTPQRLLRSDSGPFTYAGNQTVATLAVPQGTTMVAVDVSITSSHWLYNADASVGFSRLNDWAAIVTADPEINATASVAQKHVYLGNAAATSPLQMSLFCAGQVATCTWSHITFYAGTPGWKTLSGFIPTTEFDASVQSDTWGHVFDIETSHQGGGAAANASYVLRSLPIRLPMFTATDVLTVSVAWLRTITGPVWVDGATGVQVDLALSNGDIFHLLSTPNGAADSTAWERTTSAPLPVALSGATVSLQIYKNVWGTPHRLQLSNLGLYLNGAPMPFPLDQTDGKCPCELGAAGRIMGDPVNTLSGASHEHASDLAVAAAGPPLIFERSYSSLLADTARYPVGVLGPGWRHSFEDRLVLSGTGSEPNTVMLETWQGNRLRFQDDNATANPVFLPPYPGVRATLLKSTDGYTLTATTQRVEVFDTSGRLTKQIDPQGHVQTLAYTSGSLTITDQTSGRAVTLTYTTVLGQTRLATLSDGTHTVMYTYDGNADLRDVALVSGAHTYWL